MGICCAIVIRTPSLVHLRSICTSPISSAATVQSTDTASASTTASASATATATATDASIHVSLVRTVYPLYLHQWLDVRDATKRWCEAQIRQHKHTHKHAQSITTATN